LFAHRQSHTTRHKADEELQGMYAEPEIASLASFLDNHHEGTQAWLHLTLEPYLACRPDAELECCWRDHFVSLDLDHQHHRLRAVLHLMPLKNVVPVSSNHSTNHSTATDAGGNVPFVLFVVVAAAATTAAVHYPMAVDAPTEGDYGMSVLVLFGGMMAIGFGWWVITGSVIPAAWGPFVITAALAGLVESDTTWDPLVVSIVEAACWMVGSFVSRCHSLGIFHICVLAVFLGLGALGLAALFLRDSWSRLLVPVVRRAVTALAAVAIPFVIAQALARAGQSVGWSVFTGGLGLCGLFVVVHLDDMAISCCILHALANTCGSTVAALTESPTTPTTNVFDLIAPIDALLTKCSWIKTAACAIGITGAVAACGHSLQSR
jgi:hypothetical protein